VAGNRIEQEIIGVFNKDVGASYSINEIAKILDKQYPYVHKKVTEFLKEGILNETIVGRSHLCSINLSSDVAILLLSLNEEKKKRDLLKKEPRLKEIISLLSSDAHIRSIVKVDGRIVGLVDDAHTSEIASVSLLGKEDFKELLFKQRDVVVLFGFETYFRALKDIQGKLRIAHLFEKG
jgi:DNA-binding Lrp family transcriptional regulator